MEFLWCLPETSEAKTDNVWSMSYSHFLLSPKAFVSTPTKSQLGKTLRAVFVMFAWVPLILVMCFCACLSKTILYHHKSDHMQMQIHVFKFFTLCRFWNNFFCNIEEKFVYDRTHHCAEILLSNSDRKRRAKCKFSGMGFRFRYARKKYYNDNSETPWKLG